MNLIHFFIFQAILSLKWSGTWECYLGWSWTMLRWPIEHLVFVMGLHLQELFTLVGHCCCAWLALEFGISSVSCSVAVCIHRCSREICRNQRLSANWCKTFYQTLVSHAWLKQLRFLDWVWIRACSSILCSTSLGLCSQALLSRLLHPGIDFASRCRRSSSSSAHSVRPPTCCCWAWWSSWGCRWWRSWCPPFAVCSCRALWWRRLGSYRCSAPSCLAGWSTDRSAARMGLWYPKTPHLRPFHPRACSPWSRRRFDMPAELGLLLVRRVVTLELRDVLAGCTLEEPVEALSVWGGQVCIFAKRSQNFLRTSSDCIIVILTLRIRGCSANVGCLYL